MLCGDAPPSTLIDWRELHVNGCVYRSHSLHVRRSPSLALRRRQGIGTKSIGYDDFQAIAKREGEKRRDEQCSSAVRVNQQNRRKIGVLARTHNVRLRVCSWCGGKSDFIICKYPHRTK